MRCWQTICDPNLPQNAELFRDLLLWLSAHLRFLLFYCCFFFLDGAALQNSRLKDLCWQREFWYTYIYIYFFIGMTDGKNTFAWDWKTGLSPSPRTSVLSAFIAAADQTRVSVSIKLCSLRDDIYVTGRLIFSHCNYRPRSMKYKCVRLLTRQQRGRPARTRAGKSGSSAGARNV